MLSLGIRATLLLRTALRAPLRLTWMCSPSVSARNYAHSRFEGRRPGVGRERPKVTPQSPSNARSQRTADAYGSEDSASAGQSPLWEESTRLPTGNPEEGLRNLLQNNALVITRQIEMLNIFIGMEQTNRYVIANEEGETLGYIAEEPRGFLASFSRQIFRTHRPFRAIVMDATGSPVLWLRRPFAFINSRMYVQRLKDYNAYSVDGEPILDTFAEVQQIWHPWRRRYNLFLRQAPQRILSTASEPQPEPEPDLFTQVAKIDQGLLAWHFTLRDARGQPIANVNRAFRGFGREIFTDTGQYFVNFDGREPEQHSDDLPKSYVVRDLSIEERALVLAMAVNIDFDYFSRHSHGGGGLFLFGSTMGSD